MLLKKLVEIESQSGREERLKDFVSTYLEERGYEVVEGEHYIATKCRSDLIVATHLDTIAVKRKFSTDGVYAYGTGVCDAKASIAAMLEAAEEELPYTLAFFCDEEEGGRGSEEFASTWKWGEMVVVMEPTNMSIASKHYGSLDLIVEVLGKESHGSMPEMGVNAIEKAVELIEKLKEICTGECTATPLKIEGGSDEYVIPSKCRVWFDILLEPGMKVEDFLDRLSFMEKYGNFKVEFAYTGFESGEVAQILGEAVRRAKLEVEYTEMRSWTDALNLTGRFDCVVWGPGELHLCHTYEERVKLEDIYKARRVLIELGEMFK